MSEQMREYILKQSAWLLRTVAEGGSTSAMEFWTITWALEAVVEDNEIAAVRYYDDLQRFESDRLVKGGN